MTTLPSACAATVGGLSGQDYLPRLMAAITRARRSVRVIQYILDTRTGSDPTHAVGHLLRCLALARARGVDVAVLLHDYGTVDRPAAGNRAGAMFLARRGVPVRLFAPRPGEQRQVLHAKTVLIDGRLAILGTQNWSAGALTENAENTLTIESEPLARQLGLYFDGMWDRAEAPEK